MSHSHEFSRETRLDVMNSLHRALQLYSQGRWEEAAKYYALAAEENSQSEASTLGLAACWRQLDRPSLALPLYARVLRRHPADAQTRLLYADCLIAAEQYRPALRHLQQVLRDRPRFSEALSAKGFVLFMLGESARAIEVLFRAVEANRKDHRSWNILGLLYVRQEDTETALCCFQTALRLKPDYQAARHNLETLRSRMLKEYGLSEDPEGLHQLVQIKKSENRYEEAADHLLQLMDDYMEQGEWVRAGQVGREVFDLNPTDVVLMKMILLHQKMGHREGTLEWSQRLIEHYRQKRVFDRCMALLDKLERVSPENGFDIGLTRATVLVDQGKRQEAKLELERLGQQSPGWERKHQLVSKALQLGLFP